MNENIVAAIKVLKDASVIAKAGFQVDFDRWNNKFTVFVVNEKNMPKSDYKPWYKYIESIHRWEKHTYCNGVHYFTLTDEAVA